MEEETPTVPSECTFYLDKPPCCLEFYPGDPEYFIVGTYELLSSEEVAPGRDDTGVENDSIISTPQRDGSLVLFQVGPGRNDITKLCTTIVPYGVLDIHFHGSKLGVASSVGTFTVFDLVLLPTNQSPQLIHITTIRIGKPETVVTSFAWDPSSAGERICVTLSTGTVNLVHIPKGAQQSGDQLSMPHDPAIEQIHTHSLEAWMAAFAPASWGLHVTTLFTGGDDAVLSSFTKPPNHKNQLEGDSFSWQQAWINRRIHTAGVTAILPVRLTSALTSGANADILLTGSYDDKLRILKLQNGSQSSRPPLVLHEVPLPGGVWRISLLSQRHIITTSASTDITAANVDHISKTIITILISCMYAGAYVVRLSFTATAARDDLGGDGSGALECAHKVLGHFAEHESMCYACVAQPLALVELESGERASNHNARGKITEQILDDGRGYEERYVVSCSFYDRRICLWKWNG